MPVVPYSIEDFLSTRTLTQVDDTVAEIFGVMLGLAASHDPGLSEELPGGGAQRTGVIGLSGAMRGSCEVRINTDAAKAIASAMLGGSPIEDGDEDSIDDSVGEVLNMLAAGWKNRVDALSGNCFLSPPTVISGTSYRVHPQHAAVKIVRKYLFDPHTFQITFLCVDIA